MKVVMQIDYNEKLRKYLEAKVIVEIVADEKVTGVLSEVGIDYVAIINSVESEIKSSAVITDGTRKGETEEQRYVQVTEIETILRLSDIRAVTRILKTAVK